MRKILWKGVAALMLAAGVFTFGNAGAGGKNGTVAQAADALKSGDWE